MSVILKALRSQQEGAEPASQGAGPAGPTDAFQVDNLGATQGNGGSGSNKRTLILVAVLIVSIVLAVVLQLMRRSESTPKPKDFAGAPAPEAAPPPATAAPAAPAAAVPAAASNDLAIARSQYQAGNYDESIKAFQLALAADPDNASIHNDMGLVLLKKELFTSAETHFAKALELDDTCAECYNNLGYLKTTLGQSIEAEKYLQKAVALKPDYPDPYFNLAVLYEKNGDVGKAVSNYKSFLKLIPKSDSELSAKIKSRIHDLSGD